MGFIKRNRNALALGLLLLLGFGLYFWGAWNEGWSNAYYSAGVKSMMSSWHNFFYASFDPAGYVSVDKPALGLWLQCLFALVFGYHGWALILPEALASVVSIWLIYKLVGDRFGKAAGLLAGLMLAVTPIFTAVSHTNNLDATLILTMTASAYFLLKGLDNRKWGFLLLSMLFVGLGFNVKMAQAFLILPAIYLAWLFFGPGKFGKRILALVLGTVVLLTVSLSWCVAVDLTPKDSRPYVGSSTENSEIDLAVGYNGVQRIFAGIGGMFGGRLSSAPGGRGFPGGQQDGGRFQGAPGQSGIFVSGSTGILRLLGSELGGQIGWLLPLSLCGALLPLLFLRKKNRPPDGETRHACFWAFGFLAMFLYFSFGGIAHGYYTATMAPVSAAAAAIGLTYLWRWYREGGWKHWLLPAALALTAAAQFVLLQRYTAWVGVLAWALPAVCAALAVTLAVLALKPMLRSGRAAKAVGAACVALLLVSPLLWSLTPLLYGSSSTIPTAGPELKKQTGTFGFGQMGPTAEQMPGLEAFLIKHNSGEQYLAALPNAMLSSSLIIDTGLNVISVGGFTGNDQIMTLDRLKALVSAGQLRYYLITGGMGGPGGGSGSSGEIEAWVYENGTAVPQSEWSSGFGQAGMMKLYDLKTTGE